LGVASENLLTVRETINQRLLVSISQEQFDAATIAADIGMHIHFSFVGRSGHQSDGVVRHWNEYTIDFVMSNRARLTDMAKIDTATAISLVQLRLLSITEFVATHGIDRLFSDAVFPAFKVLSMPGPAWSILGKGIEGDAPSD